MNVFLQWILGLATTLITAIITTVLIPMISEYLAAKTNNEKVHTVITELGDTVASAVGYYSNTVVSQLKEDGKFDLEAQKNVLGNATEEVLKGLSKSTLKILKQNDLDIQQIIIRRIEAELNKRNMIKTNDVLEYGVGDEIQSTLNE